MIDHENYSKGVRNDLSEHQNEPKTIEERSEEVSQKTETSTNNVKKMKSSAIVVEKGTKFYGKGKKKVFALEGLCMRVPHGSIYGLLGPSGCGKTTLLRCLVNRLHLDAGKIYIFGFAPGTHESAVPGGRVGYMPQELALYQEFTTAETLWYFGRIHHLPKLMIKDRTKFLIAFLDLPDPKRLITQLSGGQQRRVSLASALLHEPELLILDEPTVGVDPLLRTSIWNYLLEVSRSGNTTIIITTHYIEEASQADRVGLMRKGRLLAETSPQNLMDYFGFSSLEDVFLKLCIEDGNLETTEEEQGTLEISSSRRERSTSNSGQKREPTETILRDDSNKNIYVHPWVSLSKTERYFSTSRCNALIIKNLIRMKRNIGFLLFSFILPPIQTILFCISIGRIPHDLPMAVVNIDSPMPFFTPKVSDLYLNHLDPYIIKQKPYETFDDGYSSVEEGKTWGLIFFNSTFSSGFVTNDEEKDGTIHVYMDNTNQEIAVTIKIKLYQAMQEILLQLVSSTPLFNISESILPIKMEDPVYGLEGSTLRNFAAPGVLLTTVYFMAASLTSLSFIIERREGLLERSRVSGVKTAEALISHVVAQMLVMLVQIALIIIVMFPIFQIPCEGNIFWVILLSILQGISGMCYGLMVSGLSKDEITAMEVILGTFYVDLFTSGIVWPVEGMPSFMRYISYFLPQTYACEGIRAVLFRGWGIIYFDVYIGYIITIIWTLIYIGIAAFTIKI